MTCTDATTSIGRLRAGLPVTGSVTFALFTSAPLCVLRAPFRLMCPSGPRTTPGTSGRVLSKPSFTFGALRSVCSEIVSEAEAFPPVGVAVTVTATPTGGNASASETISEQTLRNAPNVNEGFESTLPLVPGVVRGPDGHINLKGARSTKSGALVNSANVTDPVTGSPAINLPVDVVASVKVISNPYDPQYGRFTGAVSTVDTKTGNYDGYHFSIQNFFPRLRDRGGHILGIGAPTPRATLTGPLIKG